MHIGQGTEWYAMLTCWWWNTPSGEVKVIWTVWLPMVPAPHWHIQSVCWLKSSAFPWRKKKKRRSGHLHRKKECTTWYLCGWDKHRRWWYSAFQVACNNAAAVTWSNSSYQASWLVSLVTWPLLQVASNLKSMVPCFSGCLQLGNAMPAAVTWSNSIKLSSRLIGQFGHVTASASCKQPEKHGTRHYTEIRTSSCLCNACRSSCKSPYFSVTTLLHIN